MNVTNIIGSPHAAGNTAAISYRLRSELQTLGAVVTTYALNTMTYRGCQGCWACQTTSDQCVLRDDLRPVLEDVRASGVVVIASPIYFGDVTSQTKGLIDRFFCYHATDFRTSDDPSRLPPGKTMILILTQGNSDPTAFEDVAGKYARIFGHLGFAHVHTIRAAVVSADADVFAQEGFGEVYTIRAAREGPESVVRTQGPLTQFVCETARRVMAPSS